jgi:flagellar protein FlaG
LFTTGLKFFFQDADKVIKASKNGGGVNEMEVSATNMSGTMASAPAVLNAPRQMTGSSRAGQTSGGDGAPVSDAQVRQMVEQMQAQIDSMNISLQYAFYGEHDTKLSVKVVNKESGDVVREFPPKELQALQAKMSELCGMIFNDNA